MTTSISRCRALVLVVSVVCAAVGAAVQAQEPIAIAEVGRDTPVRFDQDILPILQKNCLACHNAAEAYGELVLESPQSILLGGDSGPAVVPNNSDESLLLQVAAHAVEPVMPPDNDVGASPLTPQQLGLLKLWIDQGASGAESGSTALSPQRWQPLPPGMNPIYAVAVTPDGQYAASSRANQIFIYHVPTGQLVTRLTDPDLQARTPEGRPGIAHLDVVQSLAFNRKGDMLASGGFRSVKLWRRPQDIQQWTLAEEEPVTAVAVSRQTDTVALAAGRVIRLFDQVSGQAGRSLEGHSGQVTQLQFSDDGARLVSSSRDQTIRVWDPAEGRLVGRIDTPGPVQALTLVSQPAEQPAEPEEAPADEEAEPAEVPPPVQYIASGGEDNLIRLWNIPSQLSPPLTELPPNCQVLAVSADRKLLALATSEGIVQVIEFETGQLVHTWQAHEGPVTSLAFQPPVPQDEAAEEAEAAADGEQPGPEEAAEPEPPVQWLATGSADHTVRLWNYRTGELQASLLGSLEPIQSLGFHPEGRQLVAGAADGGVTVWDLELPAARSLQANQGTPATVAVISPDGTLLATSGLDGQQPAILVRDLQSGQVLRTLLGHEAPVTALAFSADNARLVSGAADRTARVWDLGDDKFPEVARFTGHTEPVTAVAFNSNAQQVLSGSADHSVKLWNAADGEELADLEGHAEPVVAVALGANNQPISASADKTVRFWNAESGQQVRAITEETALAAMALSRDGQQLAVALDDHTLRTYNAANGQPVESLAGHQAAVKWLTFSPDNTRLVSGGADNVAMVWNAADGRLLEIVPSEAALSVVAAGPQPEAVLVGDIQGSLRLHTLRFAAALPGMTEAVTAVAYSGNGAQIYTACADGTVRGFNTANGQQAFSANHGAAVHDLAVSPNGQLLASAGENEQIKLWNAANGAAAQPPLLEGFTGPVHSVCFAAEGTKVVGGAAGEQHELLVFSTADGALEQLLVGHSGPVADLVTAGPEGDRLVSASSDDTVRIWPLVALRRVAGHGGPITSLAAIPGTALHVLSGSQDGTLRHWDLSNGQQVRQMNHGAPVTSVAVRPDGLRFASASENHTARLWNGQNGQQVAEMKGDLRAKAQVARLQQRQTSAEARVAAAGEVLEAAQERLPAMQEEAKTAEEALAAAEKAVVDRTAARKTVTDAKAAAEKVAIEAAAEAQKAALALAMAQQRAQQAADRAQDLAARAALAKAIADGTPDNATLAQSADQAQQAVADAEAEAEKLAAAVAAPERAAEAAATKANEAAAAAVETNKPFVDASTALREAEMERQQASRAAQLAQQQAERAAAAVPAAEQLAAAAQTRLEQIEEEREQADEAATAAEQPLRTLAFSPDNRLLASGGDFAAVHTWDAETGEAIDSYAGHTAPVQTLAFTSHEALLTGSADQTAAQWVLNPDWTLERTIGSIDDPGTLSNRVAALDFSQDGQLLCTGGGEPSRGGQVHVWNVSDGSLVQAITDAHTDSVAGVELSPDGRFVASGGADKFVKVFEVETGNEVQSFEGHTDHVLGVSWKGDGRIVASCGADNTVRVWNVETGERGLTITGFNKQVTAIRFIGQTDNTVSCSGDRTVRMHNTANGQNFRNFGGAEDFVYSVDVTPDSRIVVAGGHDSVLRIWNGANAQVLHSLLPPPQPGESDDEELAGPAL